MSTLKPFVFVVCLLFTATLIHANNGTEDSSDESKAATLLSSAKKRRHFKTSVVERPSQENFVMEEGPMIAPQFQDSVDRIAGYIAGLEQRIQEENRYVDQLNAQALTELPAGISKTIGNLTYMVMIDQIRAYPDHAEVDAYMSFIAPENNKRLNFMARGIRINSRGGFSGDARLELIGDFAINETGDMQVTLKGGDFGGPEFVSPTYVLFDCDGYKEMAVAAEVTVSKNIMLPEKPNGDIDTSKPYKASFSVAMSDWNNKLASISLPPFQLPNLEGVGFTVKNAVLDLSDHQNSTLVQFPSGYLTDYYGDIDPKMWRGLFIQEVEVRLPKDFEKRGDNSRMEFGGNNLLIDQKGFSGLVRANNLVTLDQGNIGNWSFSLDQIAIGLTANRIQQAGFTGKIEIPVMEGDSTSLLNYDAQIKPKGDFLFAVSVRDKLPFNVWNAEVVLHKSSTIKIQKVNGKLRPEALLHGTMTIDTPMETGSSEKGVRFSGVKFQGLKIQSVAPFVTVQSFSLGTEGERSETAKFPVTINEVYGSIQQNDLALGVDLSIHIGDATSGFGADGRITVLGELYESGSGKLKSRFTGVEVEKFGLDVSKGSLSFKGELILFKKDEVYGRGISGTVEATFGEGLTVGAKALFGNVDGMRYWYVDAMVELSYASRIQLVPGLLNISGFAGGAYYRMAIDNSGNQNPIGISRSGVSYKPDSTMGLGLKATVLLSSVTDNVMKADATYEMAFNATGGVRYISFTGNAFIMSANATTGDLTETAKLMAAQSAASRSNSNPDGLLDSSDENDPSNLQIFGNPTSKGAAVCAHLHMVKDFNNKSFHAEAVTYINVANVITGTGPNNRAGWMVMHFSKEEWYIYVGYPDHDKRVGISFAGIAQMTAYFVTGSKIPGSPPPPSNVSEILGDINLDYMSDLESLKSGGGIGFGAEFSFDTGDLEFLIFYGRFAMGLGFDAMLKDYGNASCEGRSGQLGVNGWYANAQVYAYVQGKIGIKVKLFGKKRRVDIIDLGLAAILQAKLPNPTWMRGIVGGRYNVLGGLVKGRCKFEFEIGEECEIQQGGSVLEGLEVISSITPSAHESDVSVFNTPQVVFNFEINKEFSMLDRDNKKKSFKIVLDEYKVSHQNAPLTGTKDWNNDNTVIVFNSDQILPGESEIKVFVKVSFEVKENGAWKKVVIDNVPLAESKSITFTTGEAPDFIEPSNITYRYPLENQYLMYPQEVTQGFIRMRLGQDYLFATEQGWVQRVRIKSESGYQKYLNFTYASKQVTFNIPSDVPLNQVVSFEVIKIPTTVADAIDSNVEDVVSQVNLGDADISTEITTSEAVGSLEDLQEKILYGNNVRTSAYKSLADKFQSHTRYSIVRYLVVPRVHKLKWQILPATELFSDVELNGTSNFEPLVQYQAVNTSSNWFNNKIFPLIYENYPINNSIRITHRSVNNQNPAPTDNIYFYQFNQLSSDLSTAPTSGTAILFYNLGLTMYDDYLQLKTKAGQYIYSGGATNERISNLLNSHFPILYHDTYKFKVGYKVPGLSNTNFKYTHTLNYQ